MKMIEDHNFSKESYELIQKVKSGSDRAKSELLKHEIEAIKTYSKEFNNLFPAMSNVSLSMLLLALRSV